MSVSVPKTVTFAAAFALFLVADRPPTLHAQGQNPRDGNPSQIVTETDLDFDNIPDIVVTRTFTYQNGNAVQVVSVFDGNSVIHADGVPDSIQTQTTTFQGGKAIQDVVLIDQGGNGTIEQRREVDYTYDNQGNAILRDDKLFNHTTNVQLSHNTFASTWDNHGNLLTQVSEFDFTNDGTIDRRQFVENEYNQQGRLISNTNDIDEDGDGVVDIHNVTTVQRDNSGTNILQTTTIDDPADGTIDETRTLHSFVFEGNNIQEFTTDRDTTAGPPLDWTSQTTFVYDQQGLPVERHVAYDIGANGTVDHTFVNTSTYNQQRNVTETVNTVDIDGDGFADQRIRTTFTY